MLEKIQAFLRRFNPHSKVFIIGGFSALFLLLIFITVSVRTGQQQQTRIEVPTPTPRVLTPGKDFVEGQINVKFIEGMSDFEINQRLAKYKSRIKSTISGINVKVVEVPAGQEDTVRKQLVEEGIVKYADLDYVGHAQFSPNDSDFEKQFGLSNSGQSVKGQAGTPNADVHIKAAWDITKGNGVKVAIIDTGLDLSHPEFSSKVVAQKVLITDSVDDQFGHGTHVAGIISAVTNNGSGIAGACPDCQLMIVKALDDNGNGPYSVISQGITWAADNGAKVINMSLGGYDADNTLREAVDYAWDKGTVIVAAAGNDNTTNKFYPAGYLKTVSVAATDNKDQKASFSNYGDWVDVAAPGKDIYSTLPTKSYVIKNMKGTALNYDYLSGTSMATPLVSGVTALIWSTPSGSSRDAVIDKLLSTTDNISGTGTYWIKGRVNAEAAVGGGNRLPLGVVDEYSCSKVRGWSYDPDESGKSIAVHVYINGAVGTPNAEGYELGNTNVSRPDVNNAYAITGTHGFDWVLPDKYRDGKTHDVFVYAIDSQGGTNPEIGRGNTGKCSSTPDPTATVTKAPGVTNGPTSAPDPTEPVPTFVCGGSPDSICASPTVKPTKKPGDKPEPTSIVPTDVIGVTPTITPPVGQNPDTDCLDPRSTPEKIMDWVSGFLKKINDYIQRVLGNPQNPPPPPQPCVIQ